MQSRQELVHSSPRVVVSVAVLTQLLVHYYFFLTCTTTSTAFVQQPTRQRQFSTGGIRKLEPGSHPLLCDDHHLHGVAREIREPLGDRLHPPKSYKLIQAHQKRVAGRHLFVARAKLIADDRKHQPEPAVVGLHVVNIETGSEHIRFKLFLKNPRESFRFCSCTAMQLRMNSFEDVVF